MSTKASPIFSELIAQILTEEMVRPKESFTPRAYQMLIGLCELYGVTDLLGNECGKVSLSTQAADAVHILH
jgi:hypothetical protein